MKVLKGIISFTLIMSIIFLMIPFNIYADTGIIPTYTNNDVQNKWQEYGGTVTNFCDNPLSGGTPCKLQFNFEEPVYGYVSFVERGNYQTVYVSDAHGEYNYRWANNVGEINAVEISYMKLVNSSSESKWEFPIESFPWVSFLMQQNYNPSSWETYLKYYIPSFTIPSSSQLYYGWMFNDRDYYMSFYIDASLIWSNIYNYIVSKNITILEINELNVYNNLLLYTIKFRPINTGATTISTGSYNINLMPLYLGYNTNIISTDFALAIGVQNQFLKDIHQIANGSPESSIASSNLENANNQMTQDMNDLATIESGYNQQFNNSLQTIDFTNPVQSNQSMLPAANFVITIFNGLINNNPFSVLIIIVCILLIGKKVIGK